MPTDELVGVRQRPDTSYEMPLSPHIRNLKGMLHGGGLVLFAEHAALQAADETGRQPVVDECRRRRARHSRVTGPGP
jgi:hypothetical protein